MKKERMQQTENNRMGYFPRFAGNPNVFSYPVPTHDYVVYIDDLSWQDEHLEQLQLIRMATPDDTIRIVINSPGGVVSIAMSYVQAMRESAAQIITHAEGNVCSAGTILWLASKERTVSPLTMFMFHNYQGGTYGDGANMFSQVAFEKQYFDRLIGEFYTGVLTEEEIATIKGGGQIWTDELDICKRCPETVLLDDKNIKRMQTGQPPLTEAARQAKKAAPAKDPAAPEEKKMVKIHVNLPGRGEVVLAADAISDEEMKGFTRKEMFQIITHMAGMTETLDILEDTKLSANSKREDLIKAMRSFGKTVNDMVIAQYEAEQAKA